MTVYDVSSRHTKSFPLFPNHYFNISGMLPCCKKWKIVLLWGRLSVYILFHLSECRREMKLEGDEFFGG